MNYTKPKYYKAITDGKPDLTKSWFVYYSARRESDGKVKRFVIKGGINRLKSVTARDKRAKAIIKALTVALRDGYNPFKKDFTPKISDALEWVIRDKENRVSPEHFKSMVRLAGHFSKHCFSRKIEFIDEVNRDDVKSFLEGYKPVTHNDYLKIVRSFFNHLIRENYLTTNPAKSVAPLPQPKSNANTPLTDEEQKVITDYYRENQYSMYVLLAFFYNSGLRPKQILTVKRSDLNLERMVIVGRPEHSKTAIAQIVQLPESFRDELTNYVKSIPDNFYLFGSSVGFSPSPKRARRDALSKRWSRDVQGKLGINKTLYSIRHKSAADRYYSNIPVEAIKEFLGHDRVQTTEKYLRSIVPYNREILKGFDKEF